MIEPEIEIYTLTQDEVMPASDDEKQMHHALLDELNNLGLCLSEQRALLDTETPPITFPLMTTQQRVLYFNLLTTATRIQDYDNPIPLRVLDATISAIKQGLTKLVILHEYGTPDPVLIAQHPGEAAERWYMIARWGDHLKSEQELVQDLTYRLVAKERAKLQERLAAVESRVADAIVNASSIGLIISFNTALYK